LKLKNKKICSGVRIVRQNEIKKFVICRSDFNVFIQKLKMV
jgi:hypothetical protein